MFSREEVSWSSTIVTQQDIGDASLHANTSEYDSTPNLDNATRYTDSLASQDRKFRTGHSKGSAAKPCSRTVSPEQEAAVRKYVRDFEWLGNGTSMKSAIGINMTMYGQDGVGLTHVQCRLKFNGFVDGYDPTLEEVSVSMSAYLEGKLVRFDGPLIRPSLTRYDPMNEQYFILARHCESFALVYDVTDRNSYEALQTFYDKICLERSMRRYKWVQGQERPAGQAGLPCSHGDCSPRSPFPGVIFVFANKIDCPKAEWKVSLEEGEQFSVSIGAIFMPMSAKTGEGSGPDALFEIINHILYRRVQFKPLLEGEMPSEDRDSDAAACCHVSWFFRSRMKAAKTPLEQNMLLERDRLLERDGAVYIKNGKRTAKNPNGLYNY